MFRIVEEFLEQTGPPHGGFWRAFLFAVITSHGDDDGDRTRTEQLEKLPSCQLDYIVICSRGGI